MFGAKLLAVPAFLAVLLTVVASPILVALYRKRISFWMRVGIGGGETPGVPSFASTTEAADALSTVAWAAKQSVAARSGIFVVEGLNVISRAKNSSLKMAILVFSLLICLPGVVRAEGCRTGAAALANVSVRLNPLSAFFFGSVEEYVARNRAHFVTGGDAVVCARLMARALAQGAFRNYDPDYQRRRDELDARLGSMGVSPGPAQASPAAQLYAMAQQMDKLAYALPHAANGDYRPLWTPRNETEKMQLFAKQMFASLLQDPEMRSTFLQMRPLIEEMVNAEYRIILNMAKGL